MGLKNMEQETLLKIDRKAGQNLGHKGEQATELLEMESIYGSCYKKI